MVNDTEGRSQVLVCRKCGKLLVTSTLNGDVIPQHMCVFTGGFSPILVVSFRPTYKPL